MAGAALDRSSGIPLYRQIKSIVCEELLSGQRPDDRPMTEEELIGRFGVSRAPVRQALKELADEGYVYRERAKGTFPVPDLDRSVHRPDTLPAGDLVAYLRRQGLEPTSQVFDVAWTEPSADRTESLRLTDGERVLHYTRLISVDGEPLVYAAMWLRAPSGFSPSVSALENTGSGLTLLEREHGVVVARTDHEAWASAATPEAAARLAVAEGAPVLALESTFRTREGRPVGWRVATHRAERFRWRFTTGR